MPPFVTLITTVFTSFDGSANVVPLAPPLGRWQAGLGNKITPSYVAWDEHGRLLVGNAAKNQAGLNPTRTIYDVKRLIGRKYVPKSVPQPAPFNTAVQALQGALDERLH